MVKLILEYPGRTCVCCGRMLCDCGEGAYDRVHEEDLVPEEVAEECVAKQSVGPWLVWINTGDGAARWRDLPWDEYVAAKREHQSKIWQWKGTVLKVVT